MISVLKNISLIVLLGFILASAADPINALKKSKSPSPSPSQAITPSPSSTPAPDVMIDTFGLGHGQSHTVPSGSHSSNPSSSFTSSSLGCNDELIGCTRYGVASAITSGTDTTPSDFVSLVSSTGVPGYCGQYSQQKTYITKGYRSYLRYSFPLTPIDISSDPNTILCVDFVAVDTGANPTGSVVVEFRATAGLGTSPCNVFEIKNVTLSNQVQHAEISFNEWWCFPTSIDFINFSMSPGGGYQFYTVKYDSIDILSLYITSGSCNALPPVSC